MKTKYEVYKFYPFEYEGVEEYLREKALEGWKLVNIYGTYMKFKKIEKEELSYSIEMVKGGMLKGKNSKEALEIREKYRGDEWEFICEWDYIQIFCSKSSRKPIHIEEELKFKKIIKFSTKIFIMMALLCCLMLFNSISGFIYLNPYTLTSNLSITVFVIMLGFMINIGVDIIRYILFFIKGKKKLRENEKIEYSSSKQIKKKRIVDKIFFFIYVIGLILVLLDSKELGIAVLGIVGIGILIIYGAWKWTGKEGVRHKRSIMIIANITSFLFIVLGLIALVFSGMNYNENKVITTKLSSEDFGIPVNKENIYKNESNGILGSYNTYADNTLDYEIFESKYSWMANFYFNKKIEQFKKFNAKVELAIIGIEDEYKGYKINNENYFIIKDFNKVIIFRCNEEIEEEQILPLLDARLMR